MTLNDLSNSIYVINLKEREDRRIHIISELLKINCKNYNLFEGINGNLIPNNSKIKNGAYGLVQTYLKIYEDWKKTENENIIVIEDDCVFVPKFNERLESYMENVPEDWEILYFGGNHNYHMGAKTDQINEHCIKLNNTYSAHCVVIKNYVFEELINSLKNNPVEIDVMLASLQKKYNSYSPTKKLATQIPSYSDIENMEVDYNWLIK